ncbi:MAG TPA: PQQ-binding-like beta-propeller repeat protein [Patescibacteria group bacterium]|nr:PQQ-binding-like beta-propeller repeat protein [Patescibacteria group bacterium]
MISSWSTTGENLIWKADFIGRSTPAVFDGRVCAIGRVGTGDTKQEVVACYDAGSGARLWERRFNVYHTAVPFSRVGWANIAGDPETGNLYIHGVGGLFVCLDRKGGTVWSRSLTEELGHISGYGGRTHSPIIDEDRVILGFSNSGWGDQVPPRHRYFAFDKRTGDLIWESTPGGRPETITTQATPVTAVIDGQRLLIGGNGDGWIYAMKARTGEKVWGFHLSKQGLNTSVVVDGNKVYATSGDENIDEATKGRVVCINGSGKGDITKTGEVWRADELEIGFASPLLHAGTLYVVDDSANLFALDAATGRKKWQYNLGTVGKGSPVWADGKIYATEVNGNIHILRPDETGAVPLDHDQVMINGERHAEIYGSPAIAYGRIYIATEGGIYCLGDKSARFSPGPGKPVDVAEPKPDPAAPPAWLQVVPAEVTVGVADSVSFRAIAYDAQGRAVAATGATQGTWGVDGIAGAVDAKGRFVPDRSRGSQTGLVTLQVGEIKASARVRVFAELPWQEDFSSFEPGKNPGYWVAGANRFVVADKAGNKVLTKAFMDQGIERSSLFIGPPGMSGYTIQADLMGSAKGRRMPDMGIIAGGYTLDMMGNHQRVQIRDWTEPRLEKTIDFAWNPDVWYTLKMQVDVQKDKAIIRGKIWPAGTSEPAAWTVTAEDPVPIRQGSPGLYGYSAADIFYDNIKVTVTGR